MSVADGQQEFTFQTEIKRLLEILSHSLYQNREIALRELISNASDALDKLRHIQLTDEQYRDAEPLEIRFECDAENRILTIRDNGIGMTREELIENLGTIAHSGSLEFLSKLAEDQKKDVSLIGQFGVGFYSSFMLAEKVEVLTRSYRDTQGWRWESTGTGSFSIAEAADVPRGSQIRLHLKADLDEFLESYRLKETVQKYSTFVPYPIKFGDEQFNEMRPIWVEPKSQVSDEDYQSFFEYIAHRGSEKPLWHLHLSVDMPIQFHALLYCPATNFELLGMGRFDQGLHLCAKRILVQDDCRDLLPEYLNFLTGIVDSEDLPLNVSRETLQDHTLLPKIRRNLTGSVLKKLGELAQEDAEGYKTFLQQFGTILRTGISSDYENREKIAKLLRFPSSHQAEPGVLTGLEDYVSRASENQKQIYFLGGPSLTALLKNPNLEAFHKRNLEVLFLIDPVDEYVLRTLGKYGDKSLVAIDAADVQFPEGSEPAESNTGADSVAGTPAFETLLKLFQTALGDQIQTVRTSHRLTDSPCCLVNQDGAYSMQLQRVINASHKDAEFPKRILELNPQAGLIVRLTQLTSNPENEPFIADCARQLFTNAMLLEGYVPDPEAAVDRMNRMLAEAAQSRTSIVTS